LTHVLEHLENPIKALKRINDEWLSDKGRLFIVVPNAYAASRQLAVEMGILPHCESVTPGEREQGHHVTYSFETLNFAVLNAGLTISYKTGIFFKPLANFQWDKLADHKDIISSGYIEACYQLGFKYPELCASIMMICQKG